MRRYLLFATLAIVVLSRGVAQEPAADGIQFDLKDTVKAFHSVKNAFEQGDQMLPFLESETSDAYRSQFASKSIVLLDLDKEVSETVDSMRRRIREPFDALEKASDVKLKTAVRHKAFLEVAPEDLVIISEKGTADIHKPGSRSVYHVCLDYVLPNGPCAVIRFRLPVRGGSGNPVPYFGVRSATGKEEVLVLFSPTPKPDTHEIVLFRKDDLFGVLYNDQIKSVSVSGFSDEAYAFFHMNDTSRLIIEEIRLPRERKGTQ